MKQAVQGKQGFPHWKHREDGGSFTIPQDVRMADGKLCISQSNPNRLPRS